MNRFYFANFYFRVVFFAEYFEFWMFTGMVEDDNLLESEIIVYWIWCIAAK